MLRGPEESVTGTVGLGCKGANSEVTKGNGERDKRRVEEEQCSCVLREHSTLDF